MRDIKLLLESWGGWAATDRNGIGYSSVAAGFRGLITSSPVPRPVCSDNDGILLDSCISRLKKIILMNMRCWLLTICSEFHFAPLPADAVAPTAPFASNSRPQKVLSKGCYPRWI